ncbi:MAG: TIGR01212 family radical SAM protein [Desulforhopalus sp.]
MDPPLIRTFSYHYRLKFGAGVGKIPVDMGQSCPNRETGGCIFCRPASFTPSYLNKTDAVSSQVVKGKKHLLRSRFTKYFAYFQQETCTALPPDSLLTVCKKLLSDNDCVGLILSTRPDYVEDRLIARLADLVDTTGKDCLFELGVQSAHERSLKLLNRNHSFSDFSDAVKRIKQTGGLEVAGHLIFGIPGESERDMLYSLARVCELGVDGLKIHHLQVIRETKLHDLYLQGKVSLFTLEQYLSFLLLALPTIPSDITIHRLWATSHPDLLVGPRWNILAGQLSALLRDRMEAAGVRQGIATF